MTACEAGAHDFESGSISQPENPMYQGALIRCRRCRSGHLMEIVQEPPFDGQRARAYLRLFSGLKHEMPPRDIIASSMMSFEGTLQEMRGDGVQVAVRDPTAGLFAQLRVQHLTGGHTGDSACAVCNHSRADHELFEHECLACVWCEQFIVSRP